MLTIWISFGEGLWLQFQPAFSSKAEIFFTHFLKRNLDTSESITTISHRFYTPLGCAARLAGWPIGRAPSPQVGGGVGKTYRPSAALDDRRNLLAGRLGLLDRGRYGFSEERPRFYNERSFDIRSE